MSEENKEKIENGRKILDEIRSIKDLYKVEQIDVEEEELSFLDRITSLIRLILDDSSLNAYNALTPRSLENWKKKRFSRWLKRITLGNIRNMLYFILLATITGFLVSEALIFYSPDGIITTKTWVKAILTEVCFIFLSGYRASGWAQSLWVNSLRVGIFILMMFVISSQTLTLGTETISQNFYIEEQVKLLEKQIEEKEAQIVYYRDVKNWPSTTKQLIAEKDKLLDKLVQLKEQQSEGKNSDVSQIEQYKMYGRAFFRMLLLFISVLITRRIFTF